MITITQTCNACGKSRQLRSTNEVRLAGWREIDPDVHLCTDCIKRALGAGLPEAKAERTGEL